MPPNKNKSNMAYLKNSVRTPSFITVSVCSFNYGIGVDIFGSGWFQTLRRQRCFNSFGVNSLVVQAIYIRPIFSSKSYHNMSGTVVYLLEWPTLALCSNSGHQTKRQHVPLGWCGRQGSSPALGGVPAACFGLFFLWFTAFSDSRIRHYGRQSIVS